MSITAMQSSATYAHQSYESKAACIPQLISLLSFLHEGPYVTTEKALGSTGDCQEKQYGTQNHEAGSITCRQGERMWWDLQGQDRLESKGHLNSSVTRVFKNRKKACKYFEQGKGTCPFGSKCLYRHAYPDGRLAEPEKPRKQLSSQGTVRFFNSVRLWDFIENRESQHVPNNEDVDMTELGDLFMHLSGVESSEP
ncbi:hypothetical protein P7K49_030720 [Saguinus oedipus]|uniref:RING-type E3 ubiquitin transferase n=1 Tax=Saguinus oedipus TaxID=9490 RepID=A0ABQ9U336_SAGOE|nr:hypothetical protein P7K49_030720 [Saguinus oedipus]